MLSASSASPMSAATHFTSRACCPSAIDSNDGPSLLTSDLRLPTSDLSSASLILVRLLVFLRRLGGLESFVQGDELAVFVPAAEGAVVAERLRRHLRPANGKRSADLLEHTAAIFLGGERLRQGVM